MGRPVINIMGNVYGDLTVIGVSDETTTKGQILWKLVCKCGGLCAATSSDLNRGRTNYCKYCTDNKSIASPHKGLYGSYMGHAYKRGYTFDLTQEQFNSITKENCFYCGEPPSQMYNKKLAKYSAIYNGIDRYNNSIGYTLENVRPCCKFCNLAKSTRSAEELIDWLARVKQRG